MLSLIPRPFPALGMRLDHAFVMMIIFQLTIVRQPWFKALR